MGKCPKCGKAVTHLRGERMPVQSTSTPWEAVVYFCPNANCNAILGASLDPSEIESAVQKVLARAG